MQEPRIIGVGGVYSKFGLVVWLLDYSIVVLQDRKWYKQNMPIERLDATARNLPR